MSFLLTQSTTWARLSWTQYCVPSIVHWAVDGAGHWLSRLCGMRPVTGSAKLNGFCAIHTGSLTCSLKMTSGQPLPVRFHSWIFVCIVVAPLPSPSKVTMRTCTFGCALAYACAAGRRAASTHTVSLPEASAPGDALGPLALSSAEPPHPARASIDT